MNLKKIFFAVAVSVCVTVAGIAYIISNKSNVIKTEQDTVFVTEDAVEVSGTIENTTDSVMYVYVCGCVNNPGIVCVNQGDRIYKAIELAGGMNTDADVNAVNQADFVRDGQMLYIPAIGENYISQGESVNNGLVNINTADKQMLTTLPGIGESRAESIIQYRDTRGCFVTIEDIMNVAGIKEAAFEKIKDYICV